MTDPGLARDTWAALAPIPTLAELAPEAAERYGALGLGPTAGPLAARAAALAGAAAGIVASLLPSYDPRLVQEVVGGALADVAAVAVRREVADIALRRLLGEAIGSPGVTEAAGLARRAAEAAGEHAEGRPVFAAHLSLPWPEDAHLVLWHALVLLGEWRDDGQRAVLVTEGLSGLDALVTQAAAGEHAVRALRTSHGWSATIWGAAVARLRSRGILAADGDPVALALTDPVLLELTDTGQAVWQRLEARTDTLAAPAYEGLGAESCARLRQLCAPWSRAATANR